MKIDALVSTYRGGAAHWWQRLSGKGLGWSMVLKPSRPLGPKGDAAFQSAVVAALS